MNEHVEGGRFKRLARFATMAARTTKDLVTAEARRRLLGTDEQKLDDMLQPTAERLVKVLGGMKGAATKLGQFISLVDQDTLPEEARKTLTRLLSQTPDRMDFQLVATVIERELGQHPDRLFASFDREPLAAASLGQVHGATLHDGTEVVVKIQFPGVDKGIEADLKNVGILAKGLSMTGSMLDGREYTEEIRQTLMRELDYREEARQLEAYRQAASPWPFLVVPAVFEDYTALRVITLQRLRGPTLLEFAQSAESSPEDRYQRSIQLSCAIWGPFLREGLVHADPHPGNYIVLADGDLGVLDFGATKRLSVRFVVAYWRLLRSVFSEQPINISDVLEDAGFDISSDRERLEAWLQQLNTIVSRPLVQEEYDWANCQMTVDVRDLVAKEMVTALRCRAPTEGVMYYRALAGGAGDLRMLGACGDFRAPMRKLAEVAHAHLEPAIMEYDGPFL